MRNGNGPLVVEFTGVTGAGKSTLLAAVQQALQAEGFVVGEANAVLRSRCRLGWPARPTIHALWSHCVALPGFVRFAGTDQGRALVNLAWRIIARDGGRPALLFRLARNFIRTVGLHALLRSRQHGLWQFHFVLCDEGILHTTHNVFVHAHAAPRRAEIERFVGLLPLPDLAVHVAAPATDALDVMRQRGHARVPQGADSAEAFVGHARTAFDVLTAHPRIRERLVQVDNARASGADSGHVIAARAEAIAQLLMHWRERLTQPGLPGLPRSEGLRKSMQRRHASLTEVTP